MARERDTGELTAIQCKFYEPTHTLAKADIDSFFTASGKKPLHQPDHHLHHRQVGQERRGRAGRPADPGRSGSAWPTSPSRRSTGTSPGRRRATSPSTWPRAERRCARISRPPIDAVLAGFADARPRQADHGLRHRQDVHRPEDRRADGRRERRVRPVLFLVPSISLLSQTLREWTAQAELDMRAFAVCSDTKVGADSSRGHQRLTTCRCPPPPTRHGCSSR